MCLWVLELHELCRIGTALLRVQAGSDVCSVQFIHTVELCAFCVVPLHDCVRCTACTLTQHAYYSVTQPRRSFSRSTLVSRRRRSVVSNIIIYRYLLPIKKIRTSVCFCVRPRHTWHDHNSRCTFISGACPWTFYVNVFHPQVFSFWLCSGEKKTILSSYIVDLSIYHFQRIKINHCPSTAGCRLVWNNEKTTIIRWVRPLDSSDTNNKLRYKRTTSSC